MTSLRPPEPRPLLRGWSHAAAVGPALAASCGLVLENAADAARAAVLAVYGAALTLLFTVSALYHRGGWSDRMRAAWRRADHATIFVLIAGTYTPVAAIVLDGWLRVAMLAMVWAAALAGVIVVMAPLRLPRAASVGMYCGIGWLAVLVLPVLYTRLGLVPMLGFVAGGLLYTLGALAYGLQRPRLWPRFFGYHEVFHLLVIAASAVFFLVIASAVAARPA